jgi:hypothetical protein
MPSIMTNVRVYLTIAEDAAAESKRLLEEGRSPKPDGQPGYAVRHDPERRSFKQSFIAIAFAGMYLEALLALVGRERLGPELYKKIDRAHTTYEEKLRLLGVSGSDLLAACKRFCEARNDLMHECGFRPCRSAVPADADHPFRPRRSPVTTLGRSTSPASGLWSSRPSPSGATRR